MSEDPATYYTPQARITQNQRGVWVMRQEPYIGAAGYTTEGVDVQTVYSGALIAPDKLFPERESIYLVNGVTTDEMAGREMVLVPVEEAMHPSWLHSIVRAWRKAGHAWRWYTKLQAEENPNRFKAAANFDEAMAAVMKTDPAMNDVDRQEMRHYPRIVCLCGSTRFSEAFRKARLAEALEGSIVLTLGSDTQSDAELQLDEDALRILAERHLRQIDLADEILVLNVGGYIGTHTAAEIEYARQHGKAVRFLEPEKGA